MLEIIILSITSFIGTNIDDMIINMFFFSSAKGSRDIHYIVLGKYLGIGILVLLSLMGALGLGFFQMKYVGYLGLVPILLGIKEIFGRSGENDGDNYAIENARSSNMLWNVALVTIANGADNIGVYIPLFSGFSFQQYAVWGSVFVLMTALWCLLGYKAAEVPFLKNVIDKYKKIVVPTVYILLGLCILKKSVW